LRNSTAVGEHAVSVRPSEGGRRREFADFDSLPTIVRARLNGARVPILAVTVRSFLESHSVDDTLRALDALEARAVDRLAFEDGQRIASGAFEAALEQATRRLTTRPHPQVSRSTLL
jgi:hypothetical protein